jgi:hypothetical protein
MAPVDAACSLDQSLKHRVPFDIGMCFGQKRLEVIALPSLKLMAYNLHVLLRHRLPH